ncbi:MAG: flagellar assembly protein FliW [Lachnospiraceae bacterium]|nr:flagellar assembly protein FliW [Lachnospiraceae bacterium]
MILETDSYGEIEYQEQDLITFPDGVFGFPDLKRYLLLSLTEGDDTVLLMLSVDQPEIVFAIVNPLVFCKDYVPSLSAAELSFLDAKDDGELSYYAICTIRSNEDYLKNTVNLKCPLVIDPISRRGIQVILPNPAYHYRHKFSSFQVVAETAAPQQTEEAAQC